MTTNHDFSWSCLALYILSVQIYSTNTRSSPHWKLEGNVIVPTTYTSSLDENLNGGGQGSSRIVPAAGSSGKKKVSGGGNESYTMNSRIHDRGGTRGNGNKKHQNQDEEYFLSAEEEDELILQILATTIISSRGSWTKYGREFYCSTCPNGVRIVGDNGSDGIEGDMLDLDVAEEMLDCGRPANFTYYDQLIGIANRANHPQIPEPQVALFFKKKNSKKDTIDLSTLEKKLRKAKKEKPSSVQLYNQIGNFNRIKGHTLRAIECFRRALAVAPNNAEVLHNLARLLLTLQYLDDALFLARRSLELQTPDRSSWQQHYTLGEILKSYGHHQESMLHFKHTLELKPDHTGAIEALRELETLLAGTGLHICTLLIIIFLVLGVLLVMLSSLENEELESRPTPRHFSRALAMRSLKLGISPRAIRNKLR